MRAAKLLAVVPYAGISGQDERLTSVRRVVLQQTQYFLYYRGARSDEDRGDLAPLAHEPPTAEALRGEVGRWSRPTAPHTALGLAGSRTAVHFKQASRAA